MTASGQSQIVRFGVAVGAFFALIGGPISGYFLTKMFLEAKASNDWPSIIGILTKAEVSQNEVGQYFADVAYTYRVDGNEFIGFRIRTSDPSVYKVRDGAVQAIGDLKVGDEIPIFYNAANPRQAVIRNGVSFQDYVLLLVPFVLFGMGLRAVLLLRRTR